MHGDDRIQRIVLFGKHGARFQLFGVRADSIDLAAKILLHRGFPLPHQLKIRIDISGTATQLGIVAKLFLKPFAFPHQWL